MFAHCSKLKEIKGINNFNTSNITNINSMFFVCEELEYLDLTNFDTSNVTNINKTHTTIIILTIIFIFIIKNQKYYI